MRTAVILCRNAGVATHDFDVLMCVCYGNENLVIAPARRKRTETVRKRNFAHCGQSRRYAYHILLCNTHVDKPIGIRRFENFGCVATHKVGFEHHYTVVGFCLIDERVCKSLSQFSIVGHCAYLPVSFLHISSLMLILWQLLALSAKDAPLPLMVLSTIMLGLSC